MKPYRVYEPEWTVYQDRVSGVTVRKLTSYLGHSVHPYFTNNAFYDRGRRFIFTSDRENVTNLFSFDRETGEITQLTDFSDKRLGPAYPVKHINRERNETYYWRGGCLYALSLDDLSVRPLFVMPGKGTSVNGFKAANIGGGMTGAGGNKIYLSGTEDLSDRIYTNLAASYIGFEETFRAKPFCQIYEIDLDTGNGRVVWEEQCWVGHVNPSPALPGILTFCHEGPWNLVDNRMWTLDVNSGKVKQLRPREDPREQIGHEYWLQDGVTVGYQVHKPTEGSDILTTYTGFINCDGTGNIEAVNGPMCSPDHVHSLDKEMIVTDAGKAIKLIKRYGDRFDAPRVLAMHDSSFYFQNSHPHPCFTPDGKQILFASDIEGYINIYLADIPEYESLPYLNK